MKIPFFFKKKQVRQRRSPRKTANPWLRKAIKEESSKKLVENMVQTSPVLQAAIVAELTGLSIDPRDVKIVSPQEAFEYFIINEAIKSLSQDRQFIAMAKEVVMDIVYQSVSERFGLGKGQPGGRGNNPGDGREVSPYREGGGPADFLSMIDTVERLKAKVGSGSTLETLLKSPVISDLVKTILPLVFGGGNAQGGVASEPTVIVVEVDGRLVEMTRNGYEVYKSQKAQLAQAADNPGPPPSNDPKPVHDADAPRGAVPSDILPADPAATSPEGNIEAPAALSPVPATGDTIAMPADLSDTIRGDIVLLAGEVFADIETRTPGQCVEVLTALSRSGNAKARAVLAFLGSGVTYEGVLEKVQPYTRYDDLRPYIEMVEQNKDYFVACINAIDAADSADTGPT